MPSRRLALFALVALTPVAADWPQFRGPARDGVSKEKNLLASWPEKGPPLEWTATGIGGGYSTVSVSGDRIYTLAFGRITGVQERAVATPESLMELMTKEKETVR